MYMYLTNALKRGVAVAPNGHAVLPAFFSSAEGSPTRSMMTDVVSQKEPVYLFAIQQLETPLYKSEVFFFFFPKKRLIYQS